MALLNEASLPGNFGGGSLRLDRTRKRLALRAADRQDDGGEHQVAGKRSHRLNVHRHKLGRQQSIRRRCGHVKAKPHAEAGFSTPHYCYGMPRWLFTATFAVLALCNTATGQPLDIVLDVKIGFGGRYRPDTWTPAFATAQAAAPTPVVLRWYVPRPGREAMVIEQAAVLNPERGTHVAYLPIGPDPAGVHLTVVDTATGRTLAHWPNTLVSPIEYADAQVRQPLFVGVSGAGPALLSLDRKRYNVAYLEPALLPRHPIGYDGLDVLALNRPQIAELELDQQEAIASWVRAGGRLMMWLDLQPLPEDSPLASLIPGGGIDEFGSRRIGEEEVPYTRLREIPESQLVTLAPAGAGEIVFLHVPPDVAHRIGGSFMPETARALAPAPPPLPSGAIAAAKKAAADDMGGLATLLAVALLIGPVDWLVLRQTHRRMRRWITLPGWLAVFALLVWYMPEAHLTQTAVSIAPPTEEGVPEPLVAHVATTGSRLAPGSSDALSPLFEAGTPYWRTIGFERTPGPFRDVVFVQGDEGMFAGREGDAPPPFVAEGVAFSAQPTAD